MIYHVGKVGGDMRLELLEVDGECEQWTYDGPETTLPDALAVWVRKTFAEPSGYDAYGWLPKKGDMTGLHGYVACYAGDGSYFREIEVRIVGGSGDSE